MKAKRFWAFVLAVLMLCGLALTACGEPADESSEAPPPESSVEEPEDKLYTPEEIARWGASQAAGKAEVEDGKVKVTSTETAQAYGGVISPAVRVDFSKEVYLTFEGFETTANTAMILKMRFAGYSDSNSAYLLSNEYTDLSGDFSVNVKDTVKNYATAADNQRLIWKVGDRGPDGQTLAEGDPLIGTLKFEGESINVTIDIWCFSLGGSEAKALKFSSLEIEELSEKTLTSFSLAQSDMTGEAAKKVGDESVRLTPVFPDGFENTAVRWQSTDPAVTVTEEGLLSFEGVTSGPVSVYAMPQADVSKRVTLQVEVRGSIDSAAGIKDYFESLSFADEVADVDENVRQILAGTVLEAQQAEAGGQADFAKLYVFGNAVTYLNAYAETDADAAAELEGALPLNLAVNNETMTAEANTATVSIYKIAGDKICRLARNQALTQTGDEYGCTLALPFVTDGVKETGSYQLVVVWTDQTAVTAARVQVNLIDASGIGAYLDAEALNEITSIHERQDDYNQVVEDGLLKLQLTNPESGHHFAQPNIRVYTNAKEGEDRVVIDFNRNVMVLLEVEESYAWLNVRFLRINGDWYTAYWTDEGFAYTNILEGNKEDRTGPKQAGAFVINVDHYRDKDTFKTAIDNAVANPDGTVELNLDFQYGSTPLDAAPYGYINIRSLTFYYVD